MKFQLLHCFNITYKNTINIGFSTAPNIPILYFKWQFKKLKERIKKHSPCQDKRILFFKTINWLKREKIGNSRFQFSLKKNVNGKGIGKREKGRVLVCLIIICTSQFIGSFVRSSQLLVAQPKIICIENHFLRGVLAQNYCINGATNYTIGFVLYFCHPFGKREPFTIIHGFLSPQE